MIRVRWFVWARRFSDGLATGPHFKRVTVEPVLPQVGDVLTVKGTVLTVTDRFLHDDVQQMRRVGRPMPLQVWHVYLQLGRQK